MIPKTEALDKASLTELAAGKAATESSTAGSTAVASKKEESKKLTLGQKIKKEIMHYWDGTKLLAAEIRISSRLALKMAAGYELSRRENRQVRYSTHNGGVRVANARFSFKEQSKTWAVWCLSRFLSLYPSPSCYYQSPSNSSRISFHPPTRVRSPVKLKRHIFVKRGSKFLNSFETRFERQGYLSQPSTPKRRNSRSSSVKSGLRGSLRRKKM